VYDQIRAGKLKADRLGGDGPLRITPDNEAAWIRGQGEAA
jgi:hypothetical protein